MIDLQDIVCPVCDSLKTKEKRPKGRPRKENASKDYNSNSNIANMNSKNVDSERSAIRMLGERNILSKVFVSEALTCEDPVESHLYDILENEGKPMPCFYCGELKQENLVSLATVESFPLCGVCQKRGRGCGQRRKSRVIQPKPVKRKNPVKKKAKKAKRAKFID